MTSRSHVLAEALRAELADVKSQLRDAWQREREGRAIRLDAIGVVHAIQVAFLRGPTVRQFTGAEGDALALVPRFLADLPHDGLTLAIDDFLIKHGDEQERETAKNLRGLEQTR